MRRLTLEHHRSMAFRDWPRQDQEAWHLAVSNGDALTDPGRGAGWRPATQSRYTWLYGHWLMFLKYRGQLDLWSSPADRASLEHVSIFVDSFRDRDLAPQTIATYVQGLHNALWAMAPHRDWAWLRELVNFLVRNAHPVKDRQSRLWPIHDVYEAGILLMDRAERMTPKRPLQDSIWFRDGLMVALLAA